MKLSQQCSRCSRRHWTFATQCSWSGRAIEIQSLRSVGRQWIFTMILAVIVSACQQGTAVTTQSPAPNNTPDATNHSAEAAVNAILSIDATEESTIENGPNLDAETAVNAILSAAESSDNRSPENTTTGIKPPQVAPVQEPISGQASAVQRPSR